VTSPKRFPDLARSIARAGHRLANHSVSHPHFPALTDAEIRAQLAGTENMVHATTGGTTKPLFRFPYGDRTAHTIAVVNAQGTSPSGGPWTASAGRAPAVDGASRR
jgi:peptidoglycan/xylan/chitin deacetylase (PgdA/CDA1 family)